MCNYNIKELYFSEYKLREFLIHIHLINPDEIKNYKYYKNINS